jgi:hypothetical protein
MQAFVRSGGGRQPVPALAALRRNLQRSFNAHALWHESNSDLAVTERAE